MRVGTTPERNSGTAARALRGRRRSLRKPATLVLILGLLVTTIVPMAALTGYDSPNHGAIAGGLDPSLLAPTAGQDSSLPSGAYAVAPADAFEDFEMDVQPESVEVVSDAKSFDIRTDEYTIHVDYSGPFVDYTICPVFTDDVVRYRRVNPLTPGEGTVDHNGNALDSVSMTISDHGKEGNTVWFLESCPQFSLRQSFTLYRDYFELDVTYTPGTHKVLTTYFVGLYSDGKMVDLFSDGQPHRYVPGYEEDRPHTHGIGGWYPSYTMFAPAFDIRVPQGNLGVEWGFDETAAYVYAPVWMKDFGGGGPSTFGLKYTSTNSVVPNPGLGEVTEWNMFVRPYKYSDGQPRGHDFGYAKWSAYKIAEKYTVRNTPIFPLTMNNHAGWDGTLQSWVDSSEITVGTSAKGKDQINWNYKSAQLMKPYAGPVPAAWQLHDSPGHQMMSNNGYPIASAAHPDYRDYLINGDDYNDWWWSTTGVFWDEINVVNAYNQLRNDYNYKEDFVYDGFLKLVEESYASGHWDYVITNPFTALLHLSMVSDLSLVEGYEAVPSYNNDFKKHVASVMAFVNNMPPELRPHINVDQNYQTGSDQWAVYSVLFAAARYGFTVNLRSYDSGASQVHNLEMAQDMFLAMGADKYTDPTIWPATLNMATEGKSVTTDRAMVVLTGSGSPRIEFTAPHERYSVTNLWGSAATFDIVLPTPGYYEVEGMDAELTYTADGKAVLHGTIGAEATGHIIRKADLAASHSGSGEAHLEAGTMSADGAELGAWATGGLTTFMVGGLKAGYYNVTVGDKVIAVVTANATGWAEFSLELPSSRQTIVLEPAADVVAPVIEMTAPTAINASVNSDVVLSFSEPMDRSLTEGAFELSGPETVSGTFLWSDDSTAMTFRPDAALEPGTAYRVSLAESAADRNGTALVGPFLATFTTKTVEVEGGINGLVVDAGGKAVSGARVSVNEQTVISDQEGRFKFDSLSPGTYTVKVSKASFQDASVDVSVTDGHTSVEVTLRASVGSGTVGALSEVPVAGLEYGIALAVGAAVLLGLLLAGRTSSGTRRTALLGRRLATLIRKLRK